MFKNKLRRYRQKAKLSQTMLALRVGVAASNLSAIEHGHREAWLLLRRRLARALKVREAELFPERK